MTPEQMRDASLFELFALEAEAQTQVLSTGLLALERNPTQADHLEACMRAAHSFKGAARIVGVDAGVSVAHVMEDCLVSAQESRLYLMPEHIDALLLGTDLLLRIATPGSTGVRPEDINAYVLQMNRLLAPTVVVAKSPALPPSLESLLSTSATLTTDFSTADLLAQALRLDALALEVAPAQSAAPTTDVSSASSRVSRRRRQDTEGGERVLRVTAERLNSLLDLSSKALVETQRLKPYLATMQRVKRLQNQSGQALDSLEAKLNEAGASAEVHDALEESRRLLSQAQAMLTQQTAELDEFGWNAGRRAQQLYDTALACRMRPFADVLGGQARMVRDLGRELGKQVRLEIEGEKTQVDRDVLEKLEAPLTHLLRNAVDHGVEFPAERLLAGKPAEGLIRLKASHQAGLLVLEISDDGAGVDLDRLRRSIIERQLSPTETAAQLSEEELLSFLFLPGFSLRETVTEVSGRGVGLDAVQHMVRQLRGSVELEQGAGQGSCFHIEVPLTLSVVRSLVVEVGGEAYAFPLAHIERMRDLKSDEIVQLEGRQHFWHEGRHVGLVAASQLLQRPQSTSVSEVLKVVVIRERDAVYGVAVERFVGERTLVVLPLDPRLGKVQDISAGALLDDGSAVLIIDVEDMLRSVEKLLNTGRLERIDRRSQQVDKAVRKRVLVVDDSLTVRELQRKLLVNRGYEVAVAVDGMDGWNALRAEDFDLLITDIDMPRMDGIELVTLLRRDSRLQSLPVMVVSYKDREEDRRRGLDAGADYYLAKASFHDDALLDAVTELIGSAQG
ncbi:hybrid sensor histidine kinase/response regulator [Pseudomonas sp. CCC3.2]|uniref:hybrid sensor histidine kinase/response regulator n=1 Tax=unclassified Pseudomonas TaxID=196821 RepID=UPI002AB3E99D|nr:MULTISPECIES: hybrid sensor histidine kinase/response regulator [unclassified Pseudomonas]MDY7559295.1 hybrid sensor histidine kinase/response regulator [Pseudomonas sp. AB6]MEB0181503.1 hybrid sensor histidine kinase/response regulator [Pseudomonas sp. CCC3.2]MEB0211816.1 hybrid sensor histidine kinase/response regulator [Pseudomonas sp. AB6]